jgi:hypothetical protein
MRIARWIPNSTNTHSEYVIVIAFPLQQWLHERPSMLQYTLLPVLLLLPLHLTVMVLQLQGQGPGIRRFLYSRRVVQV